MLDIETIKKRFFTLNKERLNRTRDTLRSRQQDVMDMLPLLFHVNNANFPGFVSTETPLGISEYTPTNKTISAAKKIAHGFEFQRKALIQYDLHAMFLMGSCGSIAYNANSDFDIWLCHRPDLKAEQLNLLQQKATAVEEWAETFGLEVHFFLMDAEKFKRGANVELSSESSGSAQHHLLLEEFYRTSLLFAGRFPIWWLVPPNEEQNYDKYVANMLKRRFVRDGEIIDFGGMPSGLEHELFGAALWQLYKSVDSPYKAALKLLLMETYASEHPNTKLLCMNFKSAIYNGERSMDLLDPYIMLYRKIENYLATTMDDKRLALIQRCFYFKVGLHLGEKDSVNNSCWQREAMQGISSDWEWDQGYMSFLDHRSEWKIDRVLEERKILVDALSQSYQILSEFARKSTKLSDINQKDLHVLGRKLYAAFERKTGKVEIVNTGISNNMWERNITLHQSGNNDQPGWNLYQGNVFIDEISTTKPLKRSHSIITLITWCFLNKLIDDRTMIALHTNDSTITVSDIRAILRSQGHMFPNAKLVPTRMDDLIKSPRVIKSNIFINIGIEPSKQLLALGMTLTSGRTDALSYSGIEENLVLSIDQIIQNSWQEVMTYRHDGSHGILDCLGSYLQISPPSNSIVPPSVTCHCFTTGRGRSIAGRVQQLFDDVIECFYTQGRPDNTRYIIRIGKIFHIISFDKDTFKHIIIGSETKLMRYLSEAHSHFSPVVIDKHAMTASPLPLIFRNNKPNQIQIFYSIDKNDIETYIIDEKGSLFYQKIMNTDENIFFHQYYRFIDAVIAKQQIQVIKSNPDSSQPKKTSISFHQLVMNKKGVLCFISRENPVMNKSQGYFKLHIVADIAKGNKPRYTLFCNDKEFSSLEFGDNAFHEVARDVLSHRKIGENYPIHITDIEFSRSTGGSDSQSFLQTIHFLNYKRGIEDKLNHALNALINKEGKQAQA